jgi:hypothetical protein
MMYTTSPCSQHFTRGRLRLVMVVQVKHGQAGIRSSPGVNLLPAGHGQGGKHSVAHKAAHSVRHGKGGRHAHNVTANVLVAYLEEGIEVTGRWWLLY